MYLIEFNYHAVLQNKINSSLLIVIELYILSIIGTSVIVCVFDTGSIDETCINYQVYSLFVLTCVWCRQYGNVLVLMVCMFLSCIVVQSDLP